MFSYLLDVETIELTQVRYRDLSEKVLERLKEVGILNGCGAKEGVLNVPDWIFKANCYHHDFNYWLGCTEDDKRKADWQFYQAMVYDANNASWWLRPWYRGWAWLYYAGVRSSEESKRRFYYADQERTLEDLNKELDDATSASS
jgi:hypothetical protein